MNDELKTSCFQFIVPPSAFIIHHSSFRFALRLPPSSFRASPSTFIVNRPSLILSLLRDFYRGGLILSRRKFRVS
ncbi:MAG TPA: hypothetical protein VEY11_07450 [Pyrinomonadaceae bacterium]|nr:hypothetical protein [Pyrinomonadaceae bacterium]